MVHRVTLTLDVHEQVKLEVSFCPHKAVSVEAKMTMQVENNQFSRTSIEVIGETYQDIISLDNISRPFEELDEKEEESGKRERRAEETEMKLEMWLKKEED